MIGSRMLILAAVASAAILAPAAMSWAADEPVPFNPKATAISTNDQAAIMRATHAVLEQRTAGATLAWTGAKSKAQGASSASGTVKVLRVFEEDGRPCAEVENTFLPTGAKAGARPRHYVLEYCRLSSGIWKLGM